MSKKAIIILHKSAAEAGSVNSREFPEISNFMEIVLFFSITVITAPATSIDLILQAQDPVSLVWFNIMDDFTFRDPQGNAVALIAVTGEGNALRISSVTSPGNSRKGILGTQGQEFDYGRIRLRSITNGGGSVTFTATAEVKSEE